MITVFPNPVFEKAIISTSDPSIDQIQVTFYDLKSKEVYSASLVGNNGNFLFENYSLPQGSYFLIAKQNNTILGHAKLVVRK